jgi:hypothetical protein
MKPEWFQALLRASDPPFRRYKVTSYRQAVMRAVQKADAAARAAAIAERICRCRVCGRDTWPHAVRSPCHANDRAKRTSCARHAMTDRAKRVGARLSAVR